MKMIIKTEMVKNFKIGLIKEAICKILNIEIDKD